MKRTGKGIEEEEERKRKGGKERGRGSICGQFLNKWISLWYPKGYRESRLLHGRNFVQISFRCGHYLSSFFGGPYRYTAFGALSRPKGALPY